MRNERGGWTWVSFRRALTLQRSLVPILFVIGIAAAFLREVLFARFFGTGIEIETFRLAYSMPNLLSQSIASAFLGAVIPLLINNEGFGPARSREFVNRLLFVNVIGSAIIASTGVVTANTQSWLLAPGFSEAQLSYLASQIRIVWMFFFLVSLTFGLRAVLNARDVLWPGPSTSLVISLTFAFGCIAIAGRPGEVDWHAGYLSWMAVMSSILVIALHCLHRDNIVLGFFRGLGKYLWKDISELGVISTALIAVVFFKVSEAIPRFIDRAVASGMEPGSIAALDYSYGIINVPGVLFATSLITVAYPRFARMARSLSHWSELQRFGQLFLLGIGGAVITGYLLSNFATDIIGFIYQRGAFDELSVRQTSNLLTWHGLGLAAMVASMIITQALFAFHAFRIAIAIAALRIIGKLVAIKLLVPHYGLEGLGMTFLVAEIVALVFSATALYYYLSVSIRSSR